MIKVLIIEDEPFAQRELQRLLNNSPYNVELIGCLDSVEDAVDYFTNEKHPDLVFLDIQLSDGLSFEIFNGVKVTAPVIFTTAYDEYAIQAFKLNSIAYLLKPVEQEALNNALAKLDEWTKQIKGEGTQFTAEQLQSILALTKPKYDYKSRFGIKLGDQLKFIAVNDIAYFYAEGNEVFVQTNEGKRYIVDFTLDQILTMTDPVQFYRINRSIVANKNAILKVHKHFNSRLKIELIPAYTDEVLVSRVKVQEFLNWMEI